MDTKDSPKTLGRPRKFDKEIALLQAMGVFQRKGYEATSITDLTQELGINRPSLYSAFGNKEELFAKAIEKYKKGPIAYLKESMQEKTSRDVVKMILMKSVDLLTSTECSKGCLAIQSSISSELETVGIQHQIVKSLNQYEENIQKRFAQSVADGDLPKDSDVVLLAKYVTTIHKGLSMQAANGAKKEILYDVVNLVLKTWPGR